MRVASGGVLAIALVAGAPVAAQFDSAWIQRVAPSRPLVQTLWQPPSLPIGERDVIETAGRLGLTHEQLIAFESFLPGYLAQACALRREAIKSIIGDGVIDWDRHRDAPPRLAIQRAADARLGYERALATLDSSLFDRLADLLTAEQQPRLLFERLRRDRQRLLSDDVMIAACVDGPLLVDLGTVVEAMDLPADQRDAARSLVESFESQATARLRSLFEASVKSGIAMADAMEGNDPHGDGRAQVSRARAAMLREIIEFEEKFVDQIAAVFPSDTALAFRRAHAGAVPGIQERGMLSYLESMQDALDAADDIEPVLKQQAAELFARSIEEQNQALPELAHLTRIVNILYASWRPGGVPIVVTMEDHQQQEPLRQRQHELSQKAYQAYREANDLLAKSLSPEQFKAMRDAAVKTLNQRQQASGQMRDYSSGFQFGASNLVTMVSMGGDTWSITFGGPQSRSAAMARLGLDEDAQAVAVGAVDAALDGWREASKDLEARFRPLLQFTGSGEAFDAAAHEKATAEGLHAIDSMRALVPAAIESLGVVIDDEPQRECAITALLWSDIADPPRNCPAPMDVARSSHYRTVTTMLDRVDPAATLLAMNLPAEDSEAAWQALREEASAGEDRVWALRRRVAEAMAVASRQMHWQQSMMRQQHDDARGIDWSVYSAMQKAASEKCAQAQQARREHLAALARVHERVSNALPEDQRTRYLDAIERAAVPDAWLGLDRAQRLIDRALAAPDITEAQRQHALSALADQQAAMQENAQAVATQIKALSDAEDMTRESWNRRAPMYAMLEQLAFERDQAVDALLRLLRPSLTSEQMQRLTTEAVSR